MLPDMRGREYGRFVIERTAAGIVVTWECADQPDNSYTMTFADEHEYGKWRKECTSQGWPEVELWYVVGPDGLTDVADGEYHTRGEAEAAMTRFLRRFERQGYYKTADGVRMGMAELASETKVTREAP
jgi:hypothetical protein